MVHDTELEEKLIVGEYSVAYDALGKRYVRILGAAANDSGFDITAMRFSDGQIDHYKPFELCKYA